MFRVFNVLWGITVCALVAVPVCAQDAAKLYERHCAKCHGPAGQRPEAPDPGNRTAFDFSQCAVSSAESTMPWEIAVAQGGRAVGLSEDMPAFNDRLTEGEINALVRYIRRTCVDRGWPNGNLNFSRPIITEKAFPEDEIVLLPSHTRGNGQPSESGLAAVFEKRFGKRNNVEIEFPFASFSTDAGHVSGLQDLKAAVKHVFFADRAGTRIVSGGLEVAFPTANDANGLGEGRFRYEPFVVAGFGHALTTVQAQFAVEFEKVNEDGESEFEREYSYNLFAGRDFGQHPSRWSLGAELNGVNTSLWITPQVRKGLVRTGALAAAAGVQIPINNRDANRPAIVGYLIWDYREPVWRRE